MAAQEKASARGMRLAVLVAALGYFVDIYDLILFSVVRVKSLQSLGVPAEGLLETGVLLINMQMGGMLLGGILWGVLGDKRGRLSVLFGSIFLYSAANFANGWVGSVEVYAVLRLIAGIGLAGELGAGITLVNETLGRESRGYGTTIVATVGILGAVVAALVADAFDWRVSFVVGGAMGLVLLLLRIGVYEPGMFEQAKRSGAPLGSLFGLFSRRESLRKYLGIVLVGVPIWYVIGILVTFSPELGGALGMDPRPSAGKAVMFAYVGLTFGDLASGLLSQWLRSRKRVIRLFLLLTAGAVVLYFVVGRLSLPLFYGCCVLVGVATGYWAVFVTTASEQYGTNVRATVTTTVPNFVRGAVVPLTIAFQFGAPRFGGIASAAAVGAIAWALAWVGLWGVEETFGKELDYLEVFTETAGAGPPASSGRPPGPV